MLKKSTLTIVLLLICSVLYVSGQIPSSKNKHSSNDELIVSREIERFVENDPGFGLYRDNYFITGIPTNKKIDENTANAKYQISIRQLLFKKVFPRNHLLAITYTQKSFWDIYKKSSPFADNNYNPGLIFSRPITYQRDVMGYLILGFEHESNGLDSLNSRSWNYFVISSSYIINPTLYIEVKIWPGWVDKEANPDLYKYKGYGHVAMNYQSLNQRLIVTGTITPINKFRSFNTQLDISFKFNRKANQYAFVQWYQGYGEGLLYYSRYTSMVRFGMCIKKSVKTHFIHQSSFESKVNY